MILIVFTIILILVIFNYIYLKKNIFEKFEDDNSVECLKNRINSLRKTTNRQNEIINKNNDEINNLILKNKEKLNVINHKQNELDRYANLLKDTKYNLINEEVKNKKTEADYNSLKKNFFNTIKNKNQKINSLNKKNINKDSEINQYKYKGSPGECSIQKQIAYYNIIRNLSTLNRGKVSNISQRFGSKTASWLFPTLTK